MTGVPPFNDETPQKVFENILSRSELKCFRQSTLMRPSILIDFVLLLILTHSLPDIEWPQEDEALSTEAVEAVERLLTMDPELRPSSGDVKVMPFFQTIDWDNLQVMEPPFIPQPENATDTGYFEGENEY